MTGGVGAHELALLFGLFALLSVFAVGGAITLAPEIHRLLVEHYGWISDERFTAAIALAQSSPGPNVLFTAVLGFQIGGLLGVIATLTGVMLPSTVLAISVARWGQARQDWRGLRAFKSGMAPVTLALLAATSWILAPAASDGVPAMLLAAAATVLVWRTRVHLMWLIGAGALLGALGLI